MGRRSRKRAASPAAPPPRPADAPVRRAAPAAAPRAVTYKARREDAPKPAWAPFPLTELCILLALVLLGLGLFSHGDRRGVLLAGGIAVVTLAAGELSVREHFTGYRSHTSLLAGICAILVAIPLWLLPVPQVVILVVAILVFGLAFAGLRTAFRRRSGGVGFRV